jgi:hypothetical protein
MVRSVYSKKFDNCGDQLVLWLVFFADFLKFAEEKFQNFFLEVDRDVQIKRHLTDKQVKWSHFSLALMAEFLEQAFMNKDQEGVQAGLVLFLQNFAW